MKLVKHVLDRKGRHIISVKADDSVLDAVQASKGRIGLKKLLGKGLKGLAPAEEWIRAARKEGLWLSFRAKSKRELLDRLCTNKFGSAWWIVVEQQQPVTLTAWLKANHPQTAEVMASK